MSLRLVSIVLVWCVCSVESCPTCVGSTSSYDTSWKAYKMDYDKTYERCSEECNRRLLWEDRCKIFDEFNKRPLSNDTRYHIALNKYADWTDEEISHALLGTVVPRDVEDFLEPQGTDLKFHFPPTYFDWTDQGYVTSVKSQGSCGNCWAFATAGAVEGQLYKSCGHLVDVSVQQISDCCYDDKYRSHGCNGGWMTGAFQCIKDIGGVVTSEVYPLKRIDQDCSTPETSKTRYVCDGYTEIKSYDEEALMQYLLNVGPISCSMYAKLSLVLYDRGIYSDKDCTEKLNHAVLLTGCGTTSDGINYWIFKNSWGREWGEGGYFRILRGKNLCDIAHFCSYPVNCNIVTALPPNE